jgi:hypothetical protein
MSRNLSTSAQRQTNSREEIVPKASVSDIVEKEVGPCGNNKHSERHNIIAPRNKKARDVMIQISEMNIYLILFYYLRQTALY